MVNLQSANIGAESTPDAGVCRSINRQDWVGKLGFFRATGQSLMGLIVMAMGTQFAAQGLTNLIKGGGV